MCLPFFCVKGKEKVKMCDWKKGCGRRRKLGDIGS